jgi:hypothetical protein
MSNSTNPDYIEYEFTVEGSIHDATRFRSWITEEWRQTVNAEGFRTWRSRHRDSLSVRFYTPPYDPNPIPEVVSAFPQLTFHGSVTASAFRCFNGRKGRYR